MTVDLSPISDKKSTQSGGFRPRLRHIVGFVAAMATLFAGSLALGAYNGAADAAGNDGVLFGAFAQTRGNQNQITAYQALENQLGTKLPLLREFAGWDSNLDNRTNNWVVDGDRTLMVSIKPERRDGSEIRWRTIANAQPGSRVHNEMVELARDISKLDGTVWVAFHHEPEAKDRQHFGDSDDYIAAWRKIHNVFAQQGADVEWVWTMTSWSFEVNSNDRRSAPKWYPGDNFVDYLGADPYNWNQCRNSREGYQTLERIVTPFLEFADRHPTKELVLPEFATAGSASEKAGWIDDARSFLKQPEIASRFAAVIYFHDTQPETPNCRWWLDTDNQTLNAARRIAQDPFFHRNDGTVNAATQGVAVAAQQPATQPQAQPQNLCTVRSTSNGDLIEWSDPGSKFGYNVRRNGRWVANTSDNRLVNNNVHNGEYTVIARSKGVRTDISCSRV